MGNSPVLSYEDLPRFSNLFRFGFWGEVNLVNLEKAKKISAKVENGRKKYFY
jgi:hypothetical protein